MRGDNCSLVYARCNRKVASPWPGHIEVVPVETGGRIFFVEMLLSKNQTADP